MSRAERRSYPIKKCQSRSKWVNMVDIEQRVEAILRDFEKVEAKLTEARRTFNRPKSRQIEQSEL